MAMDDFELIEFIDGVTKEYKGDARLLASAIGSLMLGRVYGWRVLRLITSSATYTKYQRILGIQFKDVLPPETEFSDRSLAYTIAKKLGNFWQVVRGTASIDSKEKVKLI